jgi:hypothetical protein
MDRNVEGAMDRLNALGASPAAIPVGPYCYEIEGTLRVGAAPPIVKTRACPYWAGIEADGATFGWCAFLGKGDLDGEGTLALHDRVKECGQRVDGPDGES